MTVSAAPLADPVLSPEVLRQQFMLDDDVVFLNHGSFGACPKPVWEVYTAWQRQLERQPVEFFSRHTPLLASARTSLAAYLNIDPADMSFVANATSGINVIARSFPLAPGDEILTTSLEYGALDYTWEHLCQRFGATYIKAPIDLPFTTQEAIVESIWSRVTSRTKAIFMSHITSGTAVILPVEEICRRARAAGILTIVDGAHAPGQIPLDLSGMGVDIYSGNCHKWLCTPKGSAFLYVHPDQQEWIESLTISWGWRPDNTFLSRNEQQGTRDISAFLAVPRGIEFQREHRWNEVRQSCHERLVEFRARQAARTGIAPLVPNTREWFNQLALVEVMEGGDALTLKTALMLRHGIEIPCMTHNGITCVRLSMQGYVTDSDLEALETAVIAETVA
ncbi:MAG TPA: aminotransferase class V-fold PLP-dependent enzyme [Thermomicrobiales bacterium]|nr:aminotransferase class V-fold PLP-dependent enzyme [Thermomicrobiales bacterium]